jgi:hypothetical protein
MTKPLYRYVGTDTFHGVPARDLTEEEFGRLPILRQLDVQANASYELVEDLTHKTRDELISLATQVGVEEPEKLKNKDALVAAIEAAQQGSEEQS